MIKVRCPGSCGELVQGIIDGSNFLVTCPVDLYSEVKLANNIDHKSAALVKVNSAIKKTFNYLNLRYNQEYISVISQLPYGKGMASSSADISAACQLIALLNNKLLTADEIADLALSIEPTDGVFYPGIVVFDHLNGSIRRMLGSPPPMQIAVFDTGGEIDTVQFNNRGDLTQLNKTKEPSVRRALNLVIEGINKKDCHMIGNGATLSALANQPILYKPALEKIISIAGSFSAVGVNVAHSGTVIGVLFDENYCDGKNDCIAAIQSNYPDLNYLFTTKVISGGLQKSEEDTDGWTRCS